MEVCGEHAPNKFWTLINHVSHDVFEFIEGSASFDMEIDALTRWYVKTQNENLLDIF